MSFKDFGGAAVAVVVTCTTVPSGWVTDVDVDMAAAGRPEGRRALLRDYMLRSDYEY